MLLVYCSLGICYRPSNRQADGSGGASNGAANGASLTDRYVSASDRELNNGRPTNTE